MNIQGTRDQFLTCLQKVSSAAQAGNVNPIAACALFSADTSKVEAVANDQETQIRASCPAKADGKFKVAVPARKFHDILRRLDGDQKVVLDYQEGGENKPSEIKISAGNAKYKLSALDPEEFQELGAKDMKPLLKVPASKLLHALKRVSYASAVDSHRLHLNGVLLEGTAKGMHLVATDGHRMAVQALDAGKPEQEVQLILPRRSVQNLIHSLPAEGDGEVEINCSERVVRFATGSFELISNVISENFPDYASVIPRNNDKKVVVDRNGFQAKLLRATALADKDGSVTISFEKNSAKLECTSGESDVAKDELDVKYDGEKIDIGFNARFLTEMAGAVEEDGFEINILDSSSSVLVTPAVEDKKNDFQYIVMPVRL